MEAQLVLPGMSNLNTKNRKISDQRQLTVEREPTVLVGGYRQGDLLPGEEPLGELEQLAETAGARIVGRVVQNLKEINGATYIGKGKCEEIRQLALRTGAKGVIFDHDLAPAQGRNLDKLIGMKVLDRTDLILDIFATHARSRMAKVQVGLALYEYRLPRLKRLWTHLEGQKGGIGLRGGPGEKQIETDRRRLLKQIYDLKEELREIEARKERTVLARGHDHFLICLVGYTNAGKSTLMKALTGEDVLIEDKLFATLDTKTSRLRLGGGMEVLLSDTVGFIRRLPHDLVGSFHATLEETRSADLLLHVVDSSSAHARGQVAAVNSVLKEIGCAEKEVLMVLNKADAVPPDLELENRLLRCEYPGSVSISALKGAGIEQLKNEIRARAEAHALPVTVSVHAGDGKTLAFIATHFFEKQREVDGEWITYTGRASKPVLERLQHAGESVRVLSTGPAE
ncbi:MAG: GTPase HflX [Planctomycetes bacterium]|nr:GTPase HflX [Planctomycetota bacterium]